MSRDIETLLALLSIPGAGNATARRALHGAAAQHLTASRQDGG